MKTKINRPVNRQGRDSGVIGLTQEWYDLGYSDAEEDCLTSESDAYDTGYDNGRADGLEERSRLYSSSVEDRLSKVEACLTALTLSKN